MFKFKKKETSLGISRHRRQYDLPLNKGSGTIFLKTLIALMTFLAIIALSASYTLGEMTQRWSSGLENKASVEIPAEDTNNVILKQEQVDEYTSSVLKLLMNHPAVDHVEVMGREEIANLVSPWLGDDLAFDSIPLPGILSVSFKPNVGVDYQNLERRLKEIVPQARLDTHESWVRDVLKFTGALHFAAILITTIIGFTTVVAVAGAVQARMAIYHEELELLHLMGAGDRYISGQLQRYLLLLSLHGAVIGTIIGGIMLFIVGWSAGKMDISLLPDFSLSLTQILSLIFLPVFIALLAMLTARQTVLRVLAKMP